MRDGRSDKASRGRLTGIHALTLWVGAFYLAEKLRYEKKQKQIFRFFLKKGAKPVHILTLLSLCASVTSMPASVRAGESISATSEELNFLSNPTIQTAWQVASGSRREIGSQTPSSSLLIVEQAPAGVVYLATSGEIARSRDFYSSSPHWEKVSGGIQLRRSWYGIMEFTLDPFDSTHRAWVAVYEDLVKLSSIWRTDNLDAPVPTWVKIYDLQPLKGTLCAANEDVWIHRFLASPLESDLVYSAVRCSGSYNKLYVGKSQDAGLSWSWSPYVGKGSVRALGFTLSSQDEDHLWVGTGSYTSNPPFVNFSNDGAASFTQQTGLGNYYPPYDIQVPAGAGEGAVFGVFQLYDNNTIPADLGRSINGQNFVSVVADIGGYKYYPAKYYHAVRSSPDGADLFYVSKATVNSQFSWHLLYSNDGGVSWEKRSTRNTPFPSSVWLWPFDSNYILTARHGFANPWQYTQLALFSSDGGRTWIDKTGNWGAPETGLTIYSGAPGSGGGSGIVSIVDASGVVPTAATNSGDDQCFNSAYEGTQGYEGMPINTQTGGYDYSIEDLSIATSYGPLAFRRSYSTLVTGVFTNTLGYGWTHNLDTRLVFTTQPAACPV